MLVHLLFFSKGAYTMVERRKDSKGRVLKEGESERKQGGYQYRWRSKDGKRHCIYAPTLVILREKVVEIQKDAIDGVRPEAKQTTLNDLYTSWLSVKRGLKDSTLKNYQYMYELFIMPEFGKHLICDLRKSDVRRFYNYLVEDRGLKISTLDTIHTVLHQVLAFGVDDAYLRFNPSDSALAELKKVRNIDTEKRRALTVSEQNLFMTFLKTNARYNHWYPVFAVMLGTGMRVGEITGLRWEDIDLDNRTISVNHTLVYYNHRERENSGCSFSINTPKTKNSERIIPMIDSVYEAFLLEKEYQQLAGLTSKSVIDGYRNFIFINRFGEVQHNGTLNKAIRRITRECNQAVLDNLDYKAEPTLLPSFSCHTLRHTFTTRLCEAGMNVKVIQDILGHSDIKVTLNVYADVTKEFKNEAIAEFNTISNTMFTGL